MPNIDEEITKHLRSFADRLKGYYNSLKGHTCPALVSYTIDKALEEYISKIKYKDNENDKEIECTTTD